MKMIEVQSATAQLDAELKWSSISPEMAELLNGMTEDLILTMGPQHGDPRIYVFDSVVRMTHAKVLVDDEKPSKAKRVKYQQY